MESELWTWLLIAVLVLINGFFVSAEYALVGARKSRIQVLAKRGKKNAQRVVEALENLPWYIAGIQIGITMAGIGLGAVGEQRVANSLRPFFSGAGLHIVASAISFLLVTFLLVVLGELIPKYLTIRNCDRFALLLIYPLNALLLVLTPLTVFLEGAGYWILRPFGIDMHKERPPIAAKEELAAIVQEVSKQGIIEERHARFITKLLQLTELKASNIMIPRVDIVAIDVDTPPAELAKFLGSQSHTRLLACEGGDLDEVVGVLHLQDAMKVIAGEVEEIRSVLRPAIFVPPNLSLDKLVDRMREERTQMLVVRDEHGGTAGLLTLEDIVEEIFGELDDQVESAQPRIFWRPDKRVTMRGDVRTDELIEFLGWEENPLERETISTIILERLERTPKLGDTVQTPIGILRVDNMARNRITRVSLIPYQKPVSLTKQGES